MNKISDNVNSLIGGYSDKMTYEEYGKLIKDDVVREKVVI